MKKYLKLLLLMLAFTGLFLAVDGKATQAATVYLSKTDITLNKKQSYKLKLKNYSGKIYWSSSDKTICTVSSKGTVTSLKVSGTASVCARTAKGDSYTCVVRVQGGKISATSLRMKKGTVCTIRKSIKNKATWSSSKKSVATVSSSGKVTAVGAGECTITAKINKKKYKCKVKVLESYATVKVTPETAPYNGKYTTTTEYKTDKETRVMYMMRSYMKKFETEGGGTLILSPGKYGLKAGIFVPSNVTIQWSDGATVEKCGKVGSKNYKVSLMSVVPPAVVTAAAQEAAAYKEAYYKQYRADHPKKTVEEAKDAAQKALEHSGYMFNSGVKEYEGSHDCKFIGVKGGKCIMDHQGKFYTFGIELGHCKNITVQYLQFYNMDGNHFVEINSSANVTVSDCTFTDDLTTYEWDSTQKFPVGSYNDQVAEGDTQAKIANKEAINIDTCDPNYQGFNNPWAYHDYTACTNITIKNNKFYRLARPIGSHKYTCKYNSKTKKWDIQVYNTNITITGNKIYDSGCNAIIMCNWDKVTITKNTIDGVDNNLPYIYYKDIKTMPKITHPNEGYPFKYYFYNINPSKKDGNTTVVKSKSALKQKAAIAIMGGGSTITIKENDINNAYVGVAAFNLQNMNGAADNEISRYLLSEQSKNYIISNNNYTNINKGCNYFFCNDSSIAKYGSKWRSFSGKREYLPSEYNIDWDAVIDDYMTRITGVASVETETIEAEDAEILEDKSEKVEETSEATTATTEESATESTTESVNEEDDTDSAVK